MLPSLRFQTPPGLVLCLIFYLTPGLALGAPPEAAGSSCKMALAQGYIEVRRAQFGAALELFEEALGGGGDCLPEAHLGLATTYNSKNDHKRALRAAETVLLYAEDEEVLAEAHYQIGLAQDHRGPRMSKKKKLALAAFERALELSGGEHAGAIRAVFRITKETNNTDRLAELEARYPDIQVATRAEQRRAVRPQKPARKVATPASSTAPGYLAPISMLATVGEGQLFDCSSKLEIAPEAEQERFQELMEDARDVGEEVSKPEKVHAPSALYTDADRKAKVQGVVIVQAVIDAQGSVRFVKVLKGLSEGLNRATIDAICQWEFKPAEAGGSPVAVFYNLTMNFRVQ